MGQRYLLTVIEHDAPPQIERAHSKLILRVRPAASEEKRREILDEWYRRQLRQAVTPLIAKWEPLLNVKVARVFIQKMKTKRGSCSHAAARSRLNTDLAKKPPECLEYIVVHELAHLLEPTHNARFISLMDRFMPKWPRRSPKLTHLCSVRVVRPRRRPMARKPQVGKALASPALPGRWVTFREHTRVISRECRSQVAVLPGNAQPPPRPP